MKLQASVSYTSQKNCLCFTSPGFLRSLKSNQDGEVVIARISSACHTPSYMSLMPLAAGKSDTACISLNGLYASKLGYKDSEDVLVEALDKVPPSTSVWIEPVSVDDWEILELHADQVEAQLLDQLRVVWPGQIFPLWVDGAVCIFLKTVKLEPSSECGILIPLTELVVEPKVDRYESSLKNIKNRPKDFVENNNNKEVVAETNVTVDKMDILNKSSKHSLLYSILYLKWVKRIVSTLKFLVLFFWRQIPNIFSRMLHLVYPTVDKALSTPAASKHETESSVCRFNILPDDFDLVLRVEPVGNSSSSEFMEQPSTVYLHSSNDCGFHKYDAEVYLVTLTKLLSPSEKNESNSNARKPAVKNESSDSFTKSRDFSQTLSSRNGNDVNGAGQSYVIRMYVHPLSKFTMICNWNLLCCTHQLKVPACLRRQMNFSVTSKVRIRKVVHWPKNSHDIKAINLEIVAMESPPSHSVDYDYILSAFKTWFTGVSGDNNPLPITKGTLLVFPLLLSHQSDVSLGNGTSHFVEAVVSDIVLKNAEPKEINEESCETYLLSSDDLYHMKINFTKLNQPTHIPNISDTEIQLPMESLVVYGTGFEKEVNVIVEFAELALSARPLSNALGKSGTGVRTTSMLICGAKGVGKTTLCRAILHKFGSDRCLHTYVQSVSCGQLRGKKPENIKRYFENLYYELVWRQPSLLLLDDLDQLIPASTLIDDDKAPDNLYNSQVMSVVKEVLLSLSGRSEQGWQPANRVGVLITCKSKGSLHPCVAGAGTHIYSRCLVMDLPNADKRKILLGSIIQNFTDYPSPENMDDIITRTDGYAVSDLLALVQKSSHIIQLRKLTSSGEKICYGNTIGSALNKSLTGFVPASLQNAKLHKPSPLTWKQIGGLAEVKQKLMEQLVWPIKYRELFHNSGIQAQSGVLLFGPPGCGKTLIAGVVANECGLNFISIKGPEVLSKYIGASEAAVRDLFSRAKAAAPCVLFFDEFDSLAPPRGHDSTGVTDRVVNQLLTHLDGVEPLVGVTVMAASSRPDLLDPALLRPGRLDNLMYCPLPTDEERQEILVSLSENLPLHSDVDLAELAVETKDFSGADLKALLYNAQLEAAHDKFDAVSKATRIPESQLYKSLDDLSESLSSSSSTSTLSSKLEMEVEDLYTDGLSYVDEVTGQTPEHTLSAGFIGELKHTAAELIQTVQSMQMNGEENHSADYKICFDKPFPSTDRDVLLKPHKPIKKHGLHQHSKVLYFPSLHHGRSDDIPEDICNSANVLRDSILHQDRTLETEETSLKPLPFLITSGNIQKALATTKPSLSQKERNQFELLYSGFVRSKDRGNTSNKNYYEGKPKATLS
ncbi:peroxisomal ATPase PEX1-like [Clavelina lepadiformis]|uniref:peroxisomal ATPase PEX1-like n=1 Tax=Clavelina lepadiformis TaxID=159417 RepID=UPI0040431501